MTSGGPVDFKFSSGYKSKVLVEIKLSKGSVEHGYKKQLEIYKLEIYKDAERTDEAIFLVVDVGGMKSKLKNIQNEQQKKISNGLKASDIIVVDAKRKKSASKA